MTGLVSLELSDTGLTGDIPDGVMNMVNLKKLDLSDNHITGVIPSTINNLTKLETLDLSNNWLSGSIPTNIGGLVKVTTLDLSKNRFTGYLPEEISLLPYLRTFSINENGLWGNIPYTFVDSFIDNFNWFYTNLAVPLTMVNEGGEVLNVKAWLEDANYHRNNGTGRSFGGTVVTGGVYDKDGNPIPGAYVKSNEKDMVMVLSGGNFMMQHLPYETSMTFTVEKDGWVFKPSTQTIITPSKLATAPGVVSDFIGVELVTSDEFACQDAVGINWLDCIALYNLMDAGLYGSETGKAEWKTNDQPCSWGGVTCLDERVTGLVLHGKSVGTAQLPTEFADLDMLTSLAVHDNVSGTIPDSIGNLQNLVTLDLSGNKFVGAVPASIGGLSNLVNLNISNNFLTGRLPYELFYSRIDHFSWYNTNLCIPIMPPEFFLWILNSAYQRNNGNDNTCSVYSINGRVVDENANPIDGVEVRTGSRQMTVTGQDGRYTFSELSLPSSEYLVFAEKVGWTFDPIQVSVPSSALVAFVDVPSIDFIGTKAKSLVSIDGEPSSGLADGDLFVGVPPSSLEVHFTDNVLSDDSVHSVTNPDNWMLVHAGANGVFETSATSASVCASSKSASGDDVFYAIDVIKAGTALQTDQVTIPVAQFPTGLAYGSYQLYACGAASIWDANGLAINLGENDSIGFVLQPYPTATPTVTLTPTASRTPTNTAVISQTPSKTPSKKRTPTRTPAPSKTRTPTATAKATRTSTPSPTSIQTVTPTPTMIAGLVSGIPSLTVLFDDNFDGNTLEKWSQPANAWKIGNGKLKTDTACLGDSIEISTGDDTWADYVVYFDYKTNNYLTSTELLLKDAAGDALTLRLEPGNASKATIALYGATQDPFAAYTFKFVTGTWYTFKVVHIGQETQVYRVVPKVDLFMLGILDPVDHISSGGIGFGSLAGKNCGGNVSIDNVRVYIP
jgi:hypothetical protein